MKTKTQLPKYDDLFASTLEALVKLGGSGGIEEIDEQLMTDLGIPSEALDVVYEKSGAAVLPDRMSWARSFLKLAGFLDNPKRGIWVLTEEGRSTAGKSNAELKKIVSAAYKASLAAKKAANQVAIDGMTEAEQDEAAAQSWSDKLLARLQSMDPSAFERLAQRLLRESGFTRVEVRGKSGDGGIDGAGVLRVNLVSFHVLFQCKRYSGSVPAGTVRDFRGAMQGRADKGLIITTGTFTSDARKEATRDGAPAIDLIDGEALCQLLKDLRLGVSVREVRIEEVDLDEAFFGEI